MSPVTGMNPMTKEAMTCEQFLQWKQESLTK